MHATLPQLDDIIDFVADSENICDEALQGFLAVDAGNIYSSLWRSVGAWGVVFKMVKGKERRALRVWHKQLPGVKERYQLILEYLKDRDLPYFVPCEFVERGLYVDGQYLPTSRMEWVEGLNLRQYIEKKLHNSAELRRLAEAFLTMFRDLEDNHISHGDLHHDNIFIDSNGEIRLVDYDSVHVPALSGMKDLIHGKGEYQHPRRRYNKYSTEKSDYFSQLVIYLTLLALAEKPQLRTKYVTEINQDTLLIEQQYFSRLTDFKSSSIRQELLNLTPVVAELVKILESYLEEDDINDLIPFYDYLEFEDDEDDEYYFNRAEDKLNAEDYEGAIEDYNKAIELYPNYANYYFQRTTPKENLGDYEGAIEDYSKAIELDPDNDEYYYYRAVAKENIGDYNSATDDWNKAIDLDPENEWYYNYRAKAKEKLKDIEGAIGDYSKAIEINSNVEYYTARARLKKKLKDYEAAINDYKMAISLKPSGTLYNHLGNAKYWLKDYSSAIESYTKAIEFNKKESIYYSNRALSKNKNNDYIGAIEDYDTAILHNSSSAKLYSLRGDIKLVNEDLNGALKDFELAIKYNPGHHEYYLTRANILIDLNRFSEAVESYDSAIKLKPKDADYYAGRAKVKLALTDYKDSIKDYDFAIQLVENNDEDLIFLYTSIYIERAKAKELVDDLKGAIADYDTAIEHFEESEAYFLRGCAKFKLLNYTEASADLDVAIGIEDDNHTYFYWKARIQEAVEEYNHAIITYSKAIELDSKQAEYYIRRGNVKNKLGNSLGTIADYCKAIEIESNSITKYIEMGMKAEFNNTIT